MTGVVICPVLQEEDEIAEEMYEPYDGEIDWDTDLSAIESTEV